MSVPDCRVRLEPMEGRTLLSGPSPREQQMLELVNRLRTRPTQELPLLLASKDLDVMAALKFFKVDRGRLGRQWANLTPVQPLAWNDALAKSAQSHTQRMLLRRLRQRVVPRQRLHRRQ